LNYDTQEEIAQTYPEYEIPRYLKDGVIDVDYLLQDFQAFWRENSEIWQKAYGYKEAAPHLILQAFLQRVVNGGGQIIREFAAGTRRADICIVYNRRKYPMELKIWYSEKTIDEGLEQLRDYMDKTGSRKGWLVIFDRRPEKKWEDKIYTRRITSENEDILIAGC